MLGRKSISNARCCLVECNSSTTFLFSCALFLRSSFIPSHHEISYLLSFRSCQQSKQLTPHRRCYTSTRWSCLLIISSDVLHGFHEYYLASFVHTRFFSIFSSCQVCGWESCFLLILSFLAFWPFFKEVKREKLITSSFEKHPSCRGMETERLKQELSRHNLEHVECLGMEDLSKFVFHLLFTFSFHFLLSYRRRDRHVNRHLLQPQDQKWGTFSPLVLSFFLVPWTSLTEFDPDSRTRCRLRREREGESECMCMWNLGKSTESTRDRRS